MGLSWVGRLAGRGGSSSSESVRSMTSALGRLLLDEALGIDEPSRETPVLGVPIVWADLVGVARRLTPPSRKLTSDMYSPSSSSSMYLASGCTSLLTTRSTSPWPLCHLPSGAIVTVSRDLGV